MDIFTLDEGDELFRVLLVKVAEKLGADLPPGWGFTLLLFESFPEQCMLATSSIDHAHNALLLQHYEEIFREREPKRVIKIEATIIQ